ncbi:MAG: SUF system NifU family Fe-S cluster assembly protein [Anaerolineaceae bacterium]|jgi:nitrogen fixation NifU-like protein|nr:SUF system NifU family Fe-S cluster assembly protein [Anaerolineaceae bacterium]MDP7345540.1 SUF system NifU family Fe-S cluster assembly protein [Anaerolineales bacterium]|tara:strand:+ start:156 stop:542 length:387 start_codon:yes stop_codon:yes gene_type:complete
MHDMYREFILDHYKNPRFHGVLDNADITYEDDNPLCGDVIRVDLRVNGDKRVVDAAFSGQGCAISQASASMLMEEIQGKTLDEIKEYTRADILEMLGIELGPVRLKCAMLALKVLKVGAYGVQEWVED